MINRQPLSATLLACFLIACQPQDLTPIETRLDTIEKVTLQSIQAQIATINTTLGTLQGTQAELSGYVSTLQANVGILQGDYSSLTASVDELARESEKMGKDLNELKSAIPSEQDIKSWVEESFATLEKFNKVQEDMTGVKKDIESIFSRLDGLDEKTREIADNLRDVTQELTGKIETCQKDIISIQTALRELTEDMDSLKSQISSIISAVQSVVVVPDYSDGSVKVSANEPSVIRFEVYPLEAAEKLAELGPSALSLDCVETQTKSAVAFVNIPVAAVAFSGKTLMVTVEGNMAPEKALSGVTTINGRLLISDGTVTRSSEYFPLSYTEQERVITGDYEESLGEYIAQTGKPSMDLYVTFHGWSNINGVEGASVEYGFEYSSTDLTTEANVCMAEGKDDDNNFHCAMHPQLGVHYYYRAFARHDGVTTYGDIKSIVVSKVYEIVDLKEESNIPFRATISGTINIDSKWSELSKSFSICYWEEGSKPSSWYYEVIQVAEDGSFSVDLTDLNGSTKHYYYVDCEIQSSHYQSEIRSFKTHDGLWRVPRFLLDKYLGTNVYRLSMAYQDRTLLISQDSKIYSFNESGILAGSYGNLPVRPDFITSDEAGNIVIASRYQKDTEYVLYGTSDVSLRDNFFTIASGTVDIECSEMGNFKVRGDITNKAVITGFACSYAATNPNKYVAWEIKNGKASRMIAGDLPSIQSPTWSSYFGVVHPIGDSLESGLLFRSYNTRDGVYYSKDGSSWQKIISWDRDGDGGLSIMHDNMCVIDYNGKKHLILVDGQCFTYSRKNMYIYDIDTPNEPKLEEVIYLNFYGYYHGDNGSSLYREDIVCQEHNGFLYIFVSSSSWREVLCYVHAH